MSNYEDDDYKPRRTPWNGYGIIFLSIALFIFVVVVSFIYYTTERLVPNQRAIEFFFQYAPLPLIACGIGIMCNLLAKINSKL